MSKNMDRIDIYKKTINWIKNNSICEKGIAVSSDEFRPYPEVTGYYIPTLIQWGYREIAVSYADWLCRIQKADGSWFDPQDKAPYVFDTAQVLKGLLAARKMVPKVDTHIVKGCDWILSNMQPDGRLTTPTTDAWGKNEEVCSELVHLYCLSPLIEAAEVYGRPEYRENADKILDFYLKHYRDKILNFSLLSHFYAYIIEGLLDMGKEDIARTAMKNMEKYQKKSGAVPAYYHVDWVCSTGLFQLASIWFRLGDIVRGNAAFEYACSLQNESGGWYGSYVSEKNPEEMNTYFPRSEISWAAKYFLDALYYKNLSEFEKMADIFLEKIDFLDGRYKLISNLISKSEVSWKILDVGCGKGRYLKNLVEEYPMYSYYAVDISSHVMQRITCPIKEKRQGTLTNIPYENDKFDFVYTCEALEHAVDIENAVKELARVTKPGGKIVIIDKNIEEIGRMKIAEWEQWFDKNELKNILKKYCRMVEYKEITEYETHTGDHLFLGWVGIVK